MAPSGLLNLADLRRLKRLLFASRRRAAGRYAGRHRSRHRGRGVEFNDYRQYSPGDAPGDIDWKAFARSDRLFVRLSELPSDASVNVLVDASASMGYAGVDGRDSSKFDAAARLAAAIAFLVSRQGDRVSLGIVRGGLADYVPAARGQPRLAEVLDLLGRARPNGPASLAQGIRAFAHRIEARSLLVVISDLLEEPVPIFAALGAYRARGGDAAVFHVLHGDELALPEIRGGATWVDSETGERLATDPAAIREDYDRRLHAWLGVWRAGCAGRSIDYALAPTAVPYPRVLERFLVRRQ